MRLKFITFRGAFLLLSVSALFAAGCSGDDAKDPDSLPPVDSTQTTILNVNGEIGKTDDAGNEQGTSLMPG